MLIGVDQGPAITVDGGESWTPYYGLVNGQFYRVATDYDFPYHVCGPQQDSGTACVASRSDFGEIRPNDWYPAGGFENGFLIADPLDTRYMFTQGWYHVLRRYDNVTGQVIVFYQPTADDRFGGAPPLAFSPTSRRCTWRRSRLMVRPIAARLARDQPGSRGAAISSLAGSDIRPAPAWRARRRRIDHDAGAFTRPPGVIWVGTSTRLVQVTRNGGASWTNVTPQNCPGRHQRYRSVASPTPARRTSRCLSRDRHPHILSHDRLRRGWQTSSRARGRTARFASCARIRRIQPFSTPAGHAAYVSFDRGDHWQSLQLNLPTTVVSDMTVHGSDLVISTYGRGFWILDDVTPLRQARTALAAAARARVSIHARTRVARALGQHAGHAGAARDGGRREPAGRRRARLLSARAGDESVRLTISDGAGRRSANTPTWRRP